MMGAKSRADKQGKQPLLKSTSTDAVIVGRSSDNQTATHNGSQSTAVGTVTDTAAATISASENSSSPTSHHHHIDYGTNLSSSPSSSDSDDETSNRSCCSRCFDSLSSFRRSPHAVLIVVCLALFVDLLVYAILIPVLPLFVTEVLGDDSVAVGWLLSAYAAGLLIGTPICAVVSDKLQNRRGPMLGGLGALILSTIAFSLSTNLWQLALARFAQGLSAAVTYTLGLAMISDVYPVNELPIAMGIAMSVNGLGGLAGPPIGGALFAKVGFRSIFYLVAACAGLDLILRIVCIDEKWLTMRREEIKMDNQHKLKVTSNDSSAGSEGAEPGVDEANAITDTHQQQQPQPEEESSRSDDTTNPSPDLESATASASPVETTTVHVVIPSTRLVHVDEAVSDDVANGESNKADTSASDPGVKKTSTRLTLWSMLFEPSLFFTSVGVLSLSTLMTGLEPLLTLHFEDAFNADSDAIGYSFLATAIPYMVASMAIAPVVERGYNCKLIVGVGFMFMSGSLLLMPFMTSLYTSLAPMIMFGISMGIAVSPPLTEISTFLTCTGNQHAFAAGYGLWNLAWSIGMFIGPILTGYIYHHTSFWWTQLVLASMAFVSAVMSGWVGMRERRRGLYTPQKT